MRKFTKSEDLIGQTCNNMITTKVIECDEVRGRLVNALCTCGENYEITYSVFKTHKKICTCEIKLRNISQIGNKYNMLTIIKLDEHIEKNIIVLCDCGVTKSVCIKDLLLNKIKSCGCLSKSKPTVGEKYGRYEIIKDLVPVIRLNSRYKRVTALCECGVKKDVNYRELTRGNTKSCGCLNLENKIDITINNIYSNWTILSEGQPYIGLKGKNRTVNVSCVCGKKKSNVSLNSIVRGKSKSCGCKGLIKNIKDERIFNQIPISTEFEQWKPAIGYSDYLISTLGRVFTTKQKRNVYIKTENKTTIKVYIEKREEQFNIAKVLYKTFKEDWNESEASLLLIDENIYNIRLDNLFLALKSDNNVNWVSKVLGGTHASCIGNNIKNIKKIRTLTRKDIIDQYNKQKGLSTFMKLPLDVTNVNKILAISIDRIDNSRGYEKDNITLVTRFENMGRGIVSFTTFLEFCKNLNPN